MKVLSLKKNALVISSNPGMRDEIKKSLGFIGIQTLKASGSFIASLEGLKEQNVLCDLVVMEHVAEDGRAENFIQIMKKTPLTRNAHVIVIVNLEKVDEKDDVGN